MNFVRKFHTIFKAQLQHSISYPGMIVVWMFELFFANFIFLFIWKTIISTTPHLQGQQQAILSYYLLQPIIVLLVSSWHGIFLAGRIRTGRIASRLVKPIPYFTFSISNNLSEKAIKLFFLIPFIAFAAIIFPLNLSLNSLLITAFLLSLIANSILSFVIESLIGTLAFWMDDVSSIFQLLDMSKLTLGGRLIPIFLFPPVLKTIASILPFRYLGLFSLEILIGSVNNQEIIQGFAIQSFWLLFLGFLLYITWKKGLARFSAFGG